MKPDPETKNEPGSQTDKEPDSETDQEPVSKRENEPDSEAENETDSDTEKKSDFKSNTMSLNIFCTFPVILCIAMLHLTFQKLKTNIKQSIKNLSVERSREMFYAYIKGK